MEYPIRDHLEHPLQLTLTKMGTYLLTSARGKFRLWKTVENIQTCSDVGSEKNSCGVGSSSVLSSTTVRVVTVGSGTRDDFNGRNVVFGGTKDRTDDDLDNYSSGGVGDKEQNP